MKDLQSLNTEWFDRVWNRGEKDAIYEMMHDDCKVVGLPLTDLSPKEAFAAFQESVLGAFSKFKITPSVWSEDGNILTGRGTISAIHRTSGEGVEFDFAYKVTWVDGLITEAENIVEWHTALRQVGLLAESSVDELFGKPAAESPPVQG